MKKHKLTVKDIRAAVKSLRECQRLEDSGKRHYAKNYHEDGGFSISITDPVLKIYIGEMHPESFIDLAIELLNEMLGETQPAHPIMKGRPRFGNAE